MKSDLRYIIKRIIVGVAIALILMLIKGNVFAENITPYRCYNYYGTGNTNTTGTVSLVNYGSGLNMYKCESSTAQSYKIVRYDYQNIEKQGTFDVRFFVYGVIANQTTTVILQRGDYQFTCDLNTGTTDLEYGTTTTANYIVNETVYSVECKNVDLPYATNTFSIRILPQNLGYVPATTGKEVGRISQTMTFVKKSNIDAVIQQQSEQQHQDSQNTQNAINDVNNSLTDSSSPSGSDTNNAYSSFDSSTAQNGVITSLITLPIQLFTNINNSVNASCTRFDMGTLLGTRIYFNCIQPSRYLGTQLWNIIDILMSGFLVWYIAKKFIKVFENLSSLKEGDPVGD